MLHFLRITFSCPLKNTTENFMTQIQKETAFRKCNLRMVPSRNKNNT